MEHDSSDPYDRGFTDGWNRVLDVIAESNPAPVVPVVPELRFPVALRKMWTGAEVQAWIDNQLAAPVVPEGYALVPVEPTGAMINAMVEHIERMFSSEIIAKGVALCAYKSAVAAAKG